MAALILVKPGVDWTASGGLFDWTLEFLIARISDKDAAAWMQTVVDNNLGSLWLTRFPGETQDEIVRLLRSDMVEAAERELPDGPAKAAAVACLRELAELTYTRH